MKTVIATISVLLSILAGGPVLAENYVGVILGGYEKDCEVSHQGKTFPCGARKHLCLGDIVTKRPSVTLLNIKWVPYVKGAVRSETSLEAAAGKSEKLAGRTYAEAAKGYVADFLKPTEHATVALVTRGAKPAALWPVHATLMQDFSIQVAGAGEGVTSVTVIDAKGHKVYERQVNGAGAVTLAPAEMGIKPLEAYTVYVHRDHLKRKLDVALMDAATADEVLAGLADIDAKKLSAPDGAIEKAAYLQLISDAYPDKIDLYWLAGQMLEQDREQMTEAQAELSRELGARYREHNRSK